MCYCKLTDLPSGTEVVTLYVFHEPSLLSSLQDRKLTDVILEALVVKEVCLYERGIHWISWGGGHISPLQCLLFRI